MNVGVFGGTFDPIHNGHLAVAEEVRRHMRLDAIRVMPCREPPHKGRPDLTPAADRLAMVALGTQHHPNLIPSSFELQRPGRSYTVDTLRALAEQEPGNRFFFLMGMDSFQEIALWKENVDLLRLHHLVVVNRPGAPGAGGADLPEAARGRIVPGAEDEATEDGRVHMVSVTPQDVSASEIRRRARLGQDLHALVPEPVESYIRKCALYS